MPRQTKPPATRAPAAKRNAKRSAAPVKPGAAIALSAAGDDCMLTLRVPSDLMDRLRTTAVRQQRTVSGQARYLLQTGLDTVQP